MKIPMTRVLSSLLLPAAALLLASCMGKQAKPAFKQHETVDIFTKDATIEATYIAKDRKRFCLEPTLDAVHTESGGISLGFQKAGVGEGIGDQVSEGALSLGGMSPAVLITSQLMYRACELAMNLDADTELTLRIYSRFLDTVDNAIGAGKGAAAASASPAAWSLPPVPGGLSSGKDGDYITGGGSGGSDGAGDDEWDY